MIASWQIIYPSADAESSVSASSLLRQDFLTPVILLIRFKAVYKLLLMVGVTSLMR